MNRRLMIVDDDDAIRETLAHHLNRSRYEVTTVPSAEARAFVDFIVGPAARSRLRDLGLVAGAR